MAADTKERILETALELFAQSGYPGTSMNEIAGQPHKPQGLKCGSGGMKIL